MPDTGAPFFIPYVEPSDLVRTYPAADEAQALAIAAGLSAAGFNDREVITATNASWPVPTLANPVVKVTVIGGGGGGGAFTSAGNTGGASTFACAAGTATAAGGAGGISSSGAGTNAAGGFSAGNQGMGAAEGGGNTGPSSGYGGIVTIAYFDMTGVATANVTIGAGGTSTGSSPNGGTGGRGEVIVEYSAG